jgi:hypothetical protein
MPPDIDHELVRVDRLLPLAQTLGDTASLQEAESEERAASPNPAIEYRSRLPGQSARLEESSLGELGCWEAKIFYWYIRPWQADPTITRCFRSGCRIIRRIRVVTLV